MTKLLVEQNLGDNMSWHPLTKYIEQINTYYKNGIKLLYLNQNINENQKHILVNDYNFNNRLEFVKNNINLFLNKDNIEQLLKIFEPLDITIYNEFALFKYKGYIELSELGYNEADFFYLYDGLYQECRSITFNIKTMKIALAAMAKFKNYGEDDKKWSIKTITDEYNQADLVEITNKMDGSYQQFSWDKDNNCIIGSGSSSLDIEQSWRLKKGFSMLTDNYCRMIKENPEYTFSFEFISVDNPIVVKYNKNQEGMYLFNIRNNNNGLEVQYATLKDFAKRYNVKYVESYQETLGSILNQLDNYTSDEKEGWVIRFINYSKVQKNNKSFKRVKIKVNDYVLMHRALSKLVSPNAIIEAYANNKLDDFKAKVPKAYMEQIDNILNDINMYLKLIKDKENFWYSKLENSVNINNIKDVMIWINTNAPKILVQYLIQRYKGRNRNYLATCKTGLLKRPEILKRIKILQKL